MKYNTDMKNKVLGLIKNENTLHILTAVLSVMMLLLIILYRTTVKIPEHPMSTYEFDLETVSKAISDKYRNMTLN